MQKPSSETQGQLVGWIKCPWWKFTVRSKRAPGHLLLPNQFQKRLNCPLLIGQKNFFRPISEEEQPGDCDVFLDAVVAVKENLIDRHSCVARSTGKVSELMLTKPEKLQAFTRLQETNALRWIFNGGSVEGIVNFDTRCATFTFCTFILITSLYMVYNAKLAFVNRSLCAFVARLLNLSTAWKFPLHGPRNYVDWSWKNISFRF